MVIFVPLGRRRGALGMKSLVSDDWIRGLVDSCNILPLNRKVISWIMSGRGKPREWQGRTRVAGQSTKLKFQIRSTTVISSWNSHPSTRWRVRVTFEAEQE